MDTPDIDAAVLFIQYLEGRIAERTNIEQRLAALPKPGSPEVGEDGPSKTSLVFRNGRTSIISATSRTLENMGLTSYSRLHLTTQHALAITRALATLHAHSSGQGLERRFDTTFNGNYEIKDKYMFSKCPTMIHEGLDECSMGKVEECNGECGDVLTAEVTQAELAKANLSILSDRLATSAQLSHVVRQLKSLETDIKTLMEFIQFSSAVSKKWVASVGPVCASDVWVSEDESDETIAIRLRGGTSLRAPPLRDAAWIWLTLIDPITLRERYSELCDEYCNAFNSAHHRLTAEPGQPVDEILSYFDVMRDLGESFLHAFFTFLHKFTTAGHWYMDRRLFEPEGVTRTGALIEFLIENGIIGNIFIG